MAALGVAVALLAAFALVFFNAVVARTWAKGAAELPFQRSHAPLKIVGLIGALGGGAGRRCTKFGRRVCGIASASLREHAAMMELDANGRGWDARSGVVRSTFLAPVVACWTALILSRAGHRPSIDALTLVLFATSWIVWSGFVAWRVAMNEHAIRTFGSAAAEDALFRRHRSAGQGAGLAHEDARIAAVRRRGEAA